MQPFVEKQTVLLLLGQVEGQERLRWDFQCWPVFEDTSAEVSGRPRNSHLAPHFMIIHVVLPPPHVNLITIKL